MVGKAIYDRLSDTPGVYNLVGDEYHARIYPELSDDQQVFPVLIYDVQDTDPQTAYDGATMTRYSVTIISVAQTYAECIALSEQVITALHAQKGTWGGINVLGAALTSASEDVLTIADNKEAKYLLREMSFDIWVN